jgi:hypothetical protein
MQAGQEPAFNFGKIAISDVFGKPSGKILCQAVAASCASSAHRQIQISNNAWIQMIKLNSYLVGCEEWMSEMMVCIVVHALQDFNDFVADFVLLPFAAHTRFSFLGCPAS